MSSLFSAGARPLHSPALTPEGRQAPAFCPTLPPTSFITLMVGPRETDPLGASLGDLQLENCF